MISERTFASGFSPLWQSAFPLLTPNFIQVFNREYVERFRNCRGKLVRPVKRGADVDAPDLVAELAFQAAKLATRNGMGVADLFRDASLVAQAWESSLSLLRMYEGVTDEEGRELPNQAEIDDAFLLAKNIRAFLPASSVGTEFSPRIPGAGAMPECEADLAVGDKLVEVKTVTRNFSSRDLRQLLVYLALDWVSGNRRWKNGCLLNPRRGLKADFVVESLVKRISGTSVGDVFRELVDGICRDVEMDAKF